MSEMFILGIIIHSVFLFSIFDIYFKSPIVEDVVSYQPLHDPLADRLVLFVVDGLRAESFVNYTTMPYLRSVANMHGRWGISNTQVPTESRPGHVAIIAGFYEDPSAIAKGWKENPVNFDSIFNQTTFTWCWGTYDIIEIFTKGTKSDKIFAFKLDPYSDTFSSDRNTTHLDSWVFEKVKAFFNNAHHDEALKHRLFSSKIVFFLHLLGTDTSGHTHKPKTENFLTTIQFVDDGIKEIEDVIREFYNNDGKTVFLMTSDHGMTDWGSHGSGDDHEIQTPYVMWGAGVQQVKGRHLDPSTLSMSLEHRLDIHQADLTPLMATVLSIPVPVNSVGHLTAELLNMSLSNKAKAIYSNSRQLAAQYDKKRRDVESNSISLLYFPFEPFTEQKYSYMIKLTEKLLADKDYEKLIVFSEEIMQLSLKGLHYYHNYYQKPLQILVTLSFMGWIVLLLRLLSEQKNNTQMDISDMKATMADEKSVYRMFSNIVFLLLWIIGTCLVYVQNLPLQYYLYTSLPVLLWWYAVTSIKVWKKTVRQLTISRGLCTLCIEAVCYILGSMALGLSFTYRWMLSIPLLGMGVWPLLSTSGKYLSKEVLVIWLASSGLLSLFSFMPVVGKQVFIELVLAAGIIWLAVIAIFVWHLLSPLCHNRTNKYDIVFITAQAVLLVLSLQNIYAQSVRFERRTPVSYLYQKMAWIIAVVSLISPLISTRKIIVRLLAVYTSLLTFYLMLSVSHEGLFMVTLIFNISCWILIEFRLMHFETVKVSEYSFGEDNTGKSEKHLIDVERSISHQDFRRAFFFVLYIILAFFGTGNIASLNSFEVRWVTCFVTSFKPYIITGLILLKTLAPFMAVACGFRTVQHLTKAPCGYLNIIVLIYSNIMGIQLLYYVKNTGSWLEIGTSISQFVIVQVITLFIVLINQIAKVLTDVTLNEFANKLFRSKKKYV